MTKNFWTLAAAVMVAGFWGATARADDKFPNFLVPTFVGQTHTTYQEWSHFITGSVAGPNAPASPFSNPSGTPNAFDDAAATDGAFLTSGGNIYSPTGAIHPTIIIPSPNLGSGWNTQIILQTNTLGSAIDLAHVTVTPAGGSAIVAQAGDITLLGEVSLGSMGFMDDYQFVWNLSGNASSYTITFTTPESSMSWAGARVDTLATVAQVPEPTSMALMGGGGALLLLLVRCKRRRS